VHANWNRALAAALAGAKNRGTLEGQTQKATLLGNAAQLGGSLASGLAGSKLQAAQLQVQANQQAADYKSSQAAGAAQLAGWSSIL